VAIIVPRNATSRIESLGRLLSDICKISKMVIKTEYILLSFCIKLNSQFKSKIKKYSNGKNSFRNNENSSLNLI